MNHSKLQPFPSQSKSSLVSRLRQLVRIHLVETVVTTIVCSTMVTGWCIWNVGRTYQGFQSVITEEFELQKQADKIMYVDEVLTMSARLAASTGDLQWEERYQRFIPELAEASEKLLESVTDDIRSEASLTRNANRKLIAMESEAFELVRASKAPQALELLLGPEYKKQEAIYSKGNERVMAAVDDFIASKLRQYGNQLQIAIWFGAGALMVLLATWLLVLSVVRDYIRDRAAAQHALRQSRQELATRNAELRNEANARRQQEDQVRAESERLQQDISELLDVVCEIEKGDLTVQAKVNERITGLVGDNLNRLVEVLSTILRQVDNTSQEVSRSGQRHKRIAAIMADNTEQQNQAVSKALELTTAVQAAANSATAQLDVTKRSLLTLQDYVSEGQGTMHTLT
ncbi:MAG: methyl-accepting chemotaxis protein, partial [Cyanobacteria bacterium P01_F01_bin.42]